MHWWGILIVLLVAAAFAFVSAFCGVLAGIDWAEHRRVRDLRRKRANIKAALDRDPL